MRGSGKRVWRQSRAARVLSTPGFLSMLAVGSVQVRRNLTAASIFAQRARKIRRCCFWVFFTTPTPPFPKCCNLIIEPRGACDRAVIEHCVSRADALTWPPSLCSPAGAPPFNSTCATNRNIRDNAKKKGAPESCCDTFEEIDSVAYHFKCMISMTGFRNKTLNYVYKNAVLK